jgi:hypothetical protein
VSSSSIAAHKKEMEDIEDLLIGAATGAPPRFRSPLSSVTVGVATKKIQCSSLLPTPSPSIPGTQVLHLLPLFLFHFFFKFFEFLIFVLFCFSQTIFIKTFGCSHNQVKLNLIIELCIIIIN